MILVTHVQFMLDYLLHLSYFEPIMHYMVVWQFFLSNYFFSQNKSESSLNFVCFQSDINSGGPGLSIFLDSTSSESSERCLRHPQFKLWVLQSDYSTELWVWQSDYNIHLWVGQSDYSTKLQVWQSDYSTEFSVGQLEYTWVGFGSQTTVLNFGLGSRTMAVTSQRSESSNISLVVLDNILYYSRNLSF